MKLYAVAANPCNVGFFLVSSPITRELLVAEDRDTAQTMLDETYAHYASRNSRIEKDCFKIIEFIEVGE